MKKLLLLFSLFTLPFSHAFGQSWLWGQQGIGGAEGWAVATNPKGDAFLTGYFVDSLFFDAKTLFSKANREIFLVKYDNTGNVHWAIQSNSPQPAAYEYSDAVSTDNYGNSYITGEILDTITLGTYTLVAQPHPEMILAKIDSSGNVVWAKQSGGFVTSNASGLGMISDKSGNTYITGEFSDTVNFGTFRLQTKKIPDVFIAKYASNGNALWAQQAIVNPGNVGGNGNGLTLDKDGNVYMTGILTDTMTFGSTKLIGNSAGYCVFLVKYDSNGNFKWAKQSRNLLANDYTEGYAVITDKFGSIYVTGSFEDTIYFGAFKLFSPYQDIFLTKYDSTGNVIWAEQADVLDASKWTGYSLASDDSNYIYLAGGRNYTTPAAKLKFRNLTFNINNAVDPSVLIKFDTSGNAICGSILTSGGEDNCGVALDFTGQFIYWGGDIEFDTIVFGLDTLSSSGESPFVARWQDCEDKTISIQSIQNSYSINLYPNPNTGAFKIQMNNLINEADIEIYNIFSEEIYRERLNSYITEINIPGISSGVYFFRIVQNQDNLIGSGNFIILK